MTTTPAGWFPDPLDPSRLRYFDGVQWTDHYAPAVPEAPTTVVPPADPALDARPRAARRVPMWVWIVGGLVVLGVILALSPIFAAISLAVLITGIVALSKNSRTWLRFRSRKAAMVVTAAAAVTLFITSSITTAVFPSSDEMAAARVASSAEESADDAASAVEGLPPVDDEAALHAYAGESETAADTSATSGQTAVALLATLEVKGRAAKTGYARDQFGGGWLDVDRNGCDTRNDVLARDLSDIAASGKCKVMTGTLHDPYTGETIAFQRGQNTSALVQIDHVVALSDAWQKGAQSLSADQRATFANDPLNLLAVDGAANAQKSDGDAATWLPKNKAFRCEYVARQVSVKATYHLWITQAEHDAIARVLDACPTQPALTSDYSAQATEREEIAVEPVAFESTTIDDPALPSGQTQVRTAGQNGERSLTYRVKLVDGQEVARELVSDVITTPPTAQVTAVGSYVTPAPAPVQAPAPQQPSGCDSNYAEACVPIASDVDCAGGSGNGPAYFSGVARIVGTDIYDLDRDGDGYACETW